MNTPLPPDHDDDLPGEAELAALYRQLPKSQPSDALDAAVLRAAAQALSAQPPSTVASTTDAAGRKSRTRWLIPLSSAATLVLAAGLAWHMRGMPVAGTSTAAAPATPEGAIPSAAAPMQDQAAASLAKPVTPPAAQSIPLAEPTMATAVVQQAARIARQPAPSSAQVKTTERMSKSNLPDKVYGPDQPAAATDASREAAGTRAIGSAEPPAFSAASERRSRDSVTAPAPAPAPATPAVASAPVPASLRENSEAYGAEGNAAAKNLKGEPATPSVMVAPRLLPVTARDADDSPTQELEKIRLLFAQHHDNEARTRLAAFRGEHPEMQLPPDLRARLPGTR